MSLGFSVMVRKCWCAPDMRLCVVVCRVCRVRASCGAREWRAASVRCISRSFTRKLARAARKVSRRGSGGGARAAGVHGTRPAQNGVFLTVARYCLLKFLVQLGCT